MMVRKPRTALLVTAVAILLGTVSASSAQECSTGSPEILRLKSWAADAGPNDSARITFAFENVSDAALRMVEARAWFSNALGESIGGIRLSPDIELEPGEEATETRLMAGFGRVVSMEPDDVHAIICTDAVVRADGSQERFD